MLRDYRSGYARGAAAVIATELVSLWAFIDKWEDRPGVTGQDFDELRALCTTLEAAEKYLLNRAEEMAASEKEDLAIVERQNAAELQADELSMTRKGQGESA